ncbi:MAG: hypothetical protein A2W93_06040 [Bacteroidetes bacterium GWF2_43_63]|nr:MAG: hypothetical protein A2W94_06630 [Bacteroidetes bacterium GWE2_42_42]OFY56179.1 MAG: hypothetical protein A2W93_06040 [Bacteroidetes bacterium GWF2_43_63]
MQILKDIYNDIELSSALGFKGGTALLFFHDLPRFSVDLDFNLLDLSKEDLVYQKLRSLLLSHGSIFDEAKKHFSTVIVLNYGIGERKLTVEISKRNFGDRYEIKNFLGVWMKVMTEPDMFAHRLCALTDRTATANRDIFDCWVFLNRRTPVNRKIVESRMNVKLEEHIQKCIVLLEKKSDKGLLNGLGELMDDDTKKFVKTKLRIETISLLKFYQSFPIE